jgi:hypothetical protein
MYGRGLSRTDKQINKSTNIMVYKELTIKKESERTISFTGIGSLNVPQTYKGAASYEPYAVSGDSFVYLRPTNGNNSLFHICPVDGLTIIADGEEFHYSNAGDAVDKLTEFCGPFNNGGSASGVVAHDETLEGDGTAAEPLGVKPIAGLSIISGEYLRIDADIDIFLNAAGDMRQEVAGDMNQEVTGNYTINADDGMSIYPKWLDVNVSEALYINATEGITIETQGEINISAAESVSFDFEADLVLDVAYLIDISASNININSSQNNVEYNGETVAFLTKQGATTNRSYYLDIEDYGEAIFQRFNTYPFGDTFVVKNPINGNPVLWLSDGITQLLDNTGSYNIIESFDEQVNIYGLDGNSFLEIYYDGGEPVVFVHQDSIPYIDDMKSATEESVFVSCDNIWKRMTKAAFLEWLNG